MPLKHMKSLIVLVVGLLAVGCLTPEQKQKRLRDSVVGEYEIKNVNGDTWKRVFLKNGIVKWYVNGKKRAEYKLEIVNEEIRASYGSEYKDIYRINSDKSITHVAYIDHGEREDFPKEEQPTYKKIK